MHVFHKFNAPVVEVPVYLQVAKEVLGRNRLQGEFTGQWLPTVQVLLQVLFKLWSNMRSLPDCDPSKLKEVERLLECAHYVCLHQSLKDKGGPLAELEQKVFKPETRNPRP